LCGVVFFAGVFLGAAFLPLTGLEGLAGPLVTRPDLVLPRTFFSSMIAGAWFGLAGVGVRGGVEGGEGGNRVGNLGGLR